MPSFVQWVLVALSALSFCSHVAAQESSSPSSTSTSSSTPTSTTTSSAAVSTPTARNQSIFVSPEKELVFGITIPDDPSSEDIYFSLAAHPALGWAAVGIGADTMAGNALVLVVYVSASGNNVTLSPRLASHGHSEPEPYPDLRVQALPGTGLVNGTLLLNARCSNCRRWPGGGAIDVTSSAQPCMYAAGPSYEFATDDTAAPLKMHRSYGAFSVDLRAATGPSDGTAPRLDAQSSKESSGAVLRGEAKSGARDWAALFHAVIMVFCFFGLLPFGVIVLRLGNWPRWHAVNQAIALVGIIVGFGLGVSISSKYNRSRNFNNPHQVIGILIFVFMFAQFVLGFLHHRIHKKNGEKGGSPLAPFHVWLGRTIILMGIINGFLGFPLALSPRYNIILGGLIIAIGPVVAFLLLWKPVIRKKLRSRHRKQQQQTETLPPYTAEPWRQQYPPGTGNHAAATATAAPVAETRGIGLSDLRPAPRNDRSARNEGLGTVQNPREMV